MRATQIRKQGENPMRLVAIAFTALVLAAAPATAHKQPNWGCHAHSIFKWHCGNGTP